MNPVIFKITNILKQQPGMLDINLKKNHLIIHNFMLIGMMPFFSWHA